MKKYTNTANVMSRVEFEDHVQFLRRGQSVTNDLKALKMSKSILVEDLTPTKKVAEAKPKKVKAAETKVKTPKKPK